jgi:hypothetical protein
VTKSFALALLFVTLSFGPNVFAQSNEAIEACRDVSSPAKRQDCIKDYEAKLEKLRQDTARQEEQRQQEDKRRRREVEMLQQRQRQRIQSGTNCNYAVVGNTVHKTCN